MTSVTLDTDRLALMDLFTDAERQEIAAAMIESVEELLTRLPAAIESGDLEDAAEAAHMGLNEAAVVGAVELRDAFRELERACRSGELMLAREIRERVELLWPPTRQAVEDLGHRDAADRQRQSGAEPIG